MTTFLFTLGAFATVMLVMAIGVMLGRPALRGSCGGTGSACQCKEAGKAPGSCEQERRALLRRDATDAPLITLEPPKRP